MEHLENGTLIVQGCIFFCLTKKYGQIRGWGKKLLKGDKKRGKMHIFSPIGEKYAYFFPKLTKNIQNCKKKAEHFSPEARTPSF